MLHANDAVVEGRLESDGLLPVNAGKNSTVWYRMLVILIIFCACDVRLSKFKMNISYPKAYTALKVYTHTIETYIYISFNQKVMMSVCCPDFSNGDVWSSVARIQDKSHDVCV